MRNLFNEMNYYYEKGEKINIDSILIPRLKESLTNLLDLAVTVTHVSNIESIPVLREDADAISFITDSARDKAIQRVNGNVVLFMVLRNTRIIDNKYAIQQIIKKVPAYTNFKIMDDTVEVKLNSKNAMSDDIFVSFTFIKNADLNIDISDKFQFISLFKICEAYRYSSDNTRIHCSGKSKEYSIDISQLGSNNKLIIAYNDKSGFTDLLSIEKYPDDFTIRVTGSGYIEICPDIMTIVHSETASAISGFGLPTDDPKSFFNIYKKV